MDIIKIIVYTTKSGKMPFVEWERQLDLSIRRVIFQRLNRVRMGNLGDFKRIQGSNGVWELRIDLGPGYRLYFGKDSTTVIILLAGGSKRSQIRDIEKAKQYWLEYKELL